MGATIISLDPISVERVDLRVEGDRVVAFRRRSRLGGSLVFLVNVEDRVAAVRVEPRWGISGGWDLLQGVGLEVADGAFAVELGFGEVKVVYCEDLD